MSTTTRSHKAKPFVDEVLDVLSNVLFPVVIFLIWAVATTIGTIVEQNQPAQTYYDTYSPAVANLIVRLQLGTILHSVPYFSLIVLLLVSMSVCTFRRVIPKRFPKDRAVPIENFGLHGSVSIDAARDEAAESCTRYLRSRGFFCRTQTIEDAAWIFADKHRWARYGVLVAHLGFAVIALGVFLGWLAGFKGQLQIFDGGSAAVPEIRGLSLLMTRFTAQFEPVNTPSGTFYQASKFESDVVVGENGASTPASILVNHPYKTPTGVYFYQASYGYAGRMAIEHDGKKVALSGTGRLMPQDEIFLPGTSREVQYLTMLGPSDPSQVPPGVALPKTDEYALWLIHDNIPTTNRPIIVPVGKTIDLGDGFAMKALPPIAWSGLTYRYDPGEIWVGLGAAILVAGFVMALFFVPVKVYARVRAGASGAAIDVAATTTKGNAIYEDDFAGLLAGLAKQKPQSRTSAGRAEEVYA
jgi:cytochrome c biogenesis protein